LRWQEATSEHWRRLAPDGSWLDPGELTFPGDILDLADDGTGFVAAISPLDQGFRFTLSLLSLSANGVPTADPVVLVSLPHFASDSIAGAVVAHQDGASLVLWSEGVLATMTYPDHRRLHGLRVIAGSADVVTLPMPAIASTTGAQDQSGSVVTGPGGFNVVYSATNWQRFLPPGIPPPGSPLYPNRWEPTIWTGARVPTSSGGDTAPVVSLPPAPVVPDPWPYQSQQRYNDQPHTLASDGESFLLAWLDGETVWGQVRAPDLGPSGEPFVISAAPRTSGNLAAAFNGGMYVIAWSDGRATATGVDLYAARVTRGGAVVDSEPLSIAAGPGDESVTSLVPNGTCCVVATYGGSLGNARILDLTAPTLVKTSLVYAGATTGVFDQAVSLAARLSTDSGGVAGQPLTFTLETQTCTAVTDADGRAACSVVANAPAGPAEVKVSFAGSTNLAASQTTASFSVARAATAIVYRGPRVLEGATVPLAARLFLRNERTSPLVGQTITLTMRVRWVTRSCTAVTDAMGVGRCTVTPPRMTAPGSVTATFTGDASHEGAATTVPVLSVWTPRAR